jgi:hypothetical protein
MRSGKPAPARPMDTFPVVIIPDDVFRFTEPVGTKPKFWYADAAPMETPFKEEILFKEPRPHTGEDWAEKIVSELCTVLGLPHAHYDLAVWQGRPGVISRSFVPKDGRLELGNELLVKRIPGYPERQFFQARQHTLGRVLAVLQRPPLRVPLAWTGIEGITTPIEVFVGYLMLDAWIANQDRHHENWGLVVSPERTRHLAPSYDHASSLGAIETDPVRQSRLTTRDRRYALAYYVTRARSAFFASPAQSRPLLTIEAFERAGERHPSAAKIWLTRLAGVSLPQVLALFERLPRTRISASAIDFAVTMLDLNQQRLLALKELR